MTNQPSLDQRFLAADNLRNNGQVAEAVTAYRAIATEAEAAGDSLTAARAYQQAGASLNSTLTTDTPSEYRDAIAYLTAASHAYERSGDQAGMGACYRDMAIGAGKTGDPAVASYYQQALEILAKTNDLAQQAITHDKYGLYLARSGQIEAALAAIDRALTLYDQAASHNFFRATTMYDKARVLFIANQLTEAIDLAKTALSWFEADHGQHQYRERISEINGLIGICYNELGQANQAKHYLERYRKGLGALDQAVARVLERELQDLLNLRSSHQSA